MFYCLVSLLFIFDASAYTVNIYNSKPVELETVNINAGNQVTSGILKEDSLINLSSNNTLNIPKGSRVGFYPKADLDTEGYKIYDVIIVEPMASQNWKYNDELSLKINCGKQPGTGASFIFFSVLGHLDEGCVTAEEALFEDEGNSLLVARESRFKISASGKLTYAKELVRGHVNINEQTVSLYPGESIAYHENGNIHLIHINKSDVLNASTKFGDITFGQRTDDNVFPTLFHSNGQIESGWYIGSGLSFPFYALGDLYSQSLPKNSPVRFHSNGSIYQVVLNESKTLYSHISATIVRTEMQYGFTQTLNLSSGDTFELPQMAQLLFSDNNLVGLTHHEPTGLAFIYTIQELN